MSRFIVTPNAFALLACSILLVASIGCSPGTPIAPSSTPLYVVESPNFVRILSASSEVSANFVFNAPAVSKSISAETGGTVTNGFVTLEFPPHALSEDTEITLEMDQDGTLGVELGPHGIQFDRPVTLSMNLLGTNAEGRSSDSSILWYNEAKDWWEKVTKVDSSNPNQVLAELIHFSGYRANVGG